MQGIKELKKELKEAHKKQVKRMKAEILACLVSVIDRSAVDTGRYRSNWLLTLGAQDTTTTRETEEKQITINRVVNEMITAPRGDVFYYFQNNMTYGATIEYEYQRYAGRVRDDVEKLREALR